MKRVDYHMHTSMSPDSKATIESQIEKAIEIGLNEIAITDHFEYDLLDGIWQLTMDLDQYQGTIRTMQQRYKEQIVIRQGIEVGYEKMYHNELMQLLGGRSFDFMICSTHKCEHQEIALGGFYEGKDQQDAYQIYFEHVLDTVQSYELFDVYGHLDYVNRYGKYDSKVLEWTKHQDIIEAILDGLVAKGKGLEVNTSGIRYGLGYFNPQVPILKRYLEKGGEIITIGSDSHFNNHVGYLDQQVMLMLKHIGFKYYTTFENRVPEFHNLK